MIQRLLFFFYSLLSLTMCGFGGWLIWNTKFEHEDIRAFLSWAMLIMGGILWLAFTDFCTRSDEEEYEDVEQE